jgi:hypothetical protein
MCLMSDFRLSLGLPVAMISLHFESHTKLQHRGQSSLCTQMNQVWTESHVMFDDARLAHNLVAHKPEWSSLFQPPRPPDGVVWGWLTADRSSTMQDWPKISRAENWGAFDCYPRVLLSLNRMIDEPTSNQTQGDYHNHLLHVGRLVDEWDWDTLDIAWWLCWN